MMQVEPHEINQTSPIQTTPTTWSQWGKAVFAFTVVTGVYALSKTLGGVWGNEHASHVSTADQDNLPLAVMASGLGLLALRDPDNQQTRAEAVPQNIEPKG